MTVERVQEKLDALLELLQQERRAAISLDMHELERVVTCKKQLLEGFDPQPAEAEGFEDLLKQIDNENRRNAYLTWAGLGWVRETMRFFGQSTTPKTYGGSGQSVKFEQEGHLLTGKV